MARGYIRPEVPESLYRQMTGGRQILINPTEADIRDALEATQHRTRSRRLAPEAVLEAWRAFTTTAQPGTGLAGATEAPAHYRWPLQATLFQAVSITPDLDGVIIERTAIQPGTQLEWPVPGATGDPELDAQWTGSALDQRNAIVTAFWLHLSDAEITALGEHIAALGTP